MLTFIMVRKKGGHGVLGKQGINTWRKQWCNGWKKEHSFHGPMEHHISLYAIGSQFSVPIYQCHFTSIHTSAIKVRWFHHHFIFIFLWQWIPIPQMMIFILKWAPGLRFHTESNHNLEPRLFHHHWGCWKLSLVMMTQSARWPFYCNVVITNAK